MQVEKLAYDLDSAKWDHAAMPALDSPRTLVLAFGAPEIQGAPAPLADLAKAYPRSVVVGCSSAGEIHGTTVQDRSLSVTVTRFDKTDLMLAWMEVPGAAESFHVGQTLAKKLLARMGLRGVLVLSEGLGVNGSELVRGLNSALDETIVVTGGLSGDGTRFEKTWVAIGGAARSNVVAVVGFYGEFVSLGHGSKGGWDKFGPERVVTRSEGNVLYELDGKQALALYKEYLGDRAKDLPASGLLFPLALRRDAKDEKVLVRTLLAVDHERGSMTFAGDLPKGSLVQLMKADFDRLIGGAEMASAMAVDTKVGEADKDRLVIAISCVGRRLVLGDRTEEEIEAVRNALPAGSNPAITGFYSYGEISPYAKGHCDLHNQTMTLTVVAESRVPVPRAMPRDKAKDLDAAPDSSLRGAELDLDLGSDVRMFEDPTLPKAKARAQEKAVSVRPGFSPAPKQAISTPPPSTTRQAPLAKAGSSSAAPARSPSASETTKSPAVRAAAPAAARAPAAPTNGSTAKASPAATMTTVGFEVADRSYDLDSGAWSAPLPALDSPRTLVLAFGAPEVADQPQALEDLAKAYPRSVVVGCSSAGEIHGMTVRDRSVVAAIARFDKTDLKLVSLEAAGASDSYAVGQALAKRLLAKEGLRAVIVLSEGLQVNGSELVRGLNAVLDESIVVTGGLSGDGTRFKKTWVATGGKIRPNVVAAVGLYGDHVIVGHGSKGGWDKFGPERVVTRSEANVLYELDGKPALALYKEYLGERAKDLPASGLLFPLSLRESAKDDKVLVRTVLAVDHERQSMTFAGDLPKGSLVQLMKADFERLIGGASLASSTARDTMQSQKSADRLVIAISCVGRRLVLGDRTDEEIEAVADVLGAGGGAHVAGFYSYGEISPYTTGHCDLHNQTMTITVIGESEAALGARPKVAAQEVPAIPDMPARPNTRPAPPDLAATPASGLPPANVRRETPQSLPSVSSSPPASGRSPAAPRVRGSVVTRIPVTGPGVGAPVIAKEKRGDALVVTIAGRLTESFRGEAIGRELSGTVVLDLANVERITSFGVREWLTMLGASAGRASVFLARCPDAVVNQLAMIRTFAGSSQVVSFFGPYLCEACGEPFDRLFDCEDDADVIRGKEPASATCPRCGGSGRFDDDEKTFFAFALAHAGVPVPADVRAAMDALAPPEGPKEAVEKTVSGDITRVQVQRAAKAVRWQRILDGIEGKLELDIGGANLDAEGASALVRALRGLGPEITSIRVERCPRGVLESYAAGELPRHTEIASVVLDGYCPSCAAHRPAVVSVSSADARVECKRCGEALEVKDREEALRLAKTKAAKPAAPQSEGPISQGEGPRSSSPVEIATPAPAPVVAVPSTPAPTPASSAPPPKASSLTIALGVAVAGLLGIIAYSQLSRPPIPAGATTAAVAPPPVATAAASAPGSVGEGWIAPADLPPAWADRPFVAGDPDIALVGHATGAATPEAALQAARLDAVRVIVGELQRMLAPSAAHDFLKQREPTGEKRSSPDIAKRFLAQMGSFASPERVESALRKREQGIEAFVRFKLPKASLDRAADEYRATFKFQGMELGRYFPLLEATLHSESEIVVLSVEKGSTADVLDVRAGDFVASSGRGPAPTVEALKTQVNDDWAQTNAGSAFALEIESAGARRAVRFTKPARP